MELFIDLINRNYLVSCFIMLAVGGLLLLTASLSKKDVLFILCILWSVLSGVIIINIPVPGLNFGKTLILLGFMAAHIGVLIAAFVIRLSNVDSAHTRAWRITARVLLIGIFYLILFVPVIKMILY